MLLQWVGSPLVTVLTAAELAEPPTEDTVNSSVREREKYGNSPRREVSKAATVQMHSNEKQAVINQKRPPFASKAKQRRHGSKEQCMRQPQ